MAKELSEFPSDWHRERYLADLERELEGYRRRVAELAETDGEGAVADAKAGEAAVLAELKRLGRGQASASKRPAAKRKG